MHMRKATWKMQGFTEILKRLLFKSSILCYTGCIYSRKKESIKTMDGIWQYLINYFSSTTLDILFRVIGALLILFIGFKLVKGIMKRIDKKLQAKIDPSAYSFIRSVIAVGLRGLVILTAAALVGVPMTSVVTMLASAGLAIGLALQGGLSNIAGGLMIVLFRPFRVGDYIDTHRDSGRVQAITIFYTMLLTDDNRTVVIPNGTLTNASLINYTKMGTRRVDFEYAVPYQADMTLAEQTMHEVIEANEKICKDQPPFVRPLKKVGADLVYTVRVWCVSDAYEEVQYSVNEQMRAAFEAKGIWKI